MNWQDACEIKAFSVQSGLHNSFSKIWKKTISKTLNKGKKNTAFKTQDNFKLVI